MKKSINEKRHPAQGRFTTLSPFVAFEGNLQLCVFVQLKKKPIGPRRTEEHFFQRLAKQRARCHFFHVNKAKETACQQRRGGVLRFVCPFTTKAEDV